MKIWQEWKWWIISGLAAFVLLGAGAWYYYTMYDITRIKSTLQCQCAPIDLESEVKQAPLVYQGRVTRISRSLDGTYKVIVKPEQTLKGHPIEEPFLEFTVEKSCPYPFRKQHSYLFLVPMSQPGEEQIPLNECSLILNADDIDTMERIYEWLSREPASPADEQGSPSSDRTSSHDGAERIFDAMQSELYSIRIEEDQYKTWLYNAGDRLFFYSPQVKISFFVTLDTEVNIDEYNRFIQGISIHRKLSGREVPFATGEVNVEVRELPIVLKLFDAPPQDLIVRIQDPRGGEGLEIPIQYIEPFTYSVTSETDPGLEDYMNLLRQGYQGVHYVMNGRTHRYTFTFNHPVDRGSVYEKLNESLMNHQTIAWSLQWSNDYEVQLSLVLDEWTTERISFTLNGIRTEQGYPLVAAETWTIQPTEPLVFTAIDLATNTKEAYFTSVVPYAVLDVSPLGGYLLAGMEAHNGIHVVYRYILLDRFGNVMKTFEVEEIRDPEWISEDQLAYATDQELHIYDLPTDTTKTVWQVPNYKDEERIVSFDYAHQDGTLAVSVGYTDEGGNFMYDLYIFDSFADPEPGRIEQFGSYECVEGECGVPQLLFTDQQHIVYTRWESTGDSWDYVPVLYMTDLENLQTRRFNPLNSLDAYTDYMLYPLHSGKVLYIADITMGAAQDSDVPPRERWSLYDPAADRFEYLFDTELGLFTDLWLSQLIQDPDGQIMLHLYERGWYTLDLESGRLTPYDALSAHIEVIDVAANRIWYME